jgi:hypothetical protein
LLFLFFPTSHFQRLFYQKLDEASLCSSLHSSVQNSPSAWGMFVSPPSLPKMTSTEKLSRTTPCFSLCSVSPKILFFKNACQDQHVLSSALVVQINPHQSFVTFLYLSASNPDITKKNCHAPCHGLPPLSFRSHIYRKTTGHNEMSFVRLPLCSKPPLKDRSRGIMCAASSSRIQNFKAKYFGKTQLGYIHSYVVCTRAVQNTCVLLRDFHKPDWDWGVL